ncbi:hypothetical protein GCM10025859_20300 [Alicyclobacillus fastidiosus]|nr:class I tRNA ligase family protein [Alicyclobacillus fastidiosus]GMA61590.1 hypothetical protein GCM10025859_20300 [Alicyclobacillus fastidiosus]
MELAAPDQKFSLVDVLRGKFSTSLKRGIFLDDALALYPADYWRYFLLAQSPEADDAGFTWELFATVINKDLVGNFGNFVNRTLTLTSRHFGSQVPGGRAPFTEVEVQLKADCARVVSQYRTHLRQTEFRKALKALRELWSLGNRYLDSRAPWAQLLELDGDFDGHLFELPELLFRRVERADVEAYRRRFGGEHQA